MASWLICRAIALAVVLTLVAMPATADDLADFNAAVERAAAHNRVAFGYLRTDSTDLAVLEIERMQEAWSSLVQRFGKARPAAFRDNRLYTETMVDVPTKLIGTLLVLDMGRTDLARTALQGIREKLSAMRRESGVVVLADCVLDANAAMAAFFKFDDAPPNWRNAGSVADLVARAAALSDVMQRCDGLADPDLRQQAEFRRLVDGTLASLKFVPQAIAKHDNNLLHRLIGELRAFDNLLVFRYG